jgi:hypothetical protein
VIGLLALVVLVGGGVVAFLLLRERPGPGMPKGYPGGPGDYPGGYGDFGQAGGYPGYPGVGMSGTSGRMSAADYPTPHGRSGVYEPGGYGGVGAGAVSQWDELPSEPGPGPGWQPRPMTGYGRLDLPPDGSGRGTREWQDGADVPDDPWAEVPYDGAQNGYGGDPGYAGGQRYGGGDGGRSGWGNFGEDDGSGATRPGYGGGQDYGQDPYGPPRGSGGTGRQPRPGRARDDDYPGGPGPWPDPHTGGGGDGSSGRGW